MRHSKEKMVPLGAFLRVRQNEGPRAIERLNGESMVEISANHAPGASLAQSRTLCEKRAEVIRKELELPAAYRLTWLHDMPATP